MTAFFYPTNLQLFHNWYTNSNPSSDHLICSDPSCCTLVIILTKDRLPPFDHDRRREGDSSHDDREVGGRTTVNGKGMKSIGLLRVRKIMELTEV